MNVVSHTYMVESHSLCHTENECIMSYCTCHLVTMANLALCCRCHNRANIITIKSCLTKNANLAGSEARNKVVMSEHGSTHAFSVEKNYKDSSSCFEVIDSVWNYLVTIFQTRSYSFEAVSLMFALHKTRFANTDTLLGCGQMWPQCYSGVSATNDT